MFSEAKEIESLLRLGEYRTFPFVGFTIFARIERRVVLPQPESPENTYRWPEENSPENS